MKINRAAFLALTGSIATSTLAACASDPKSTDAGAQADAAVAADMSAAADSTVTANDAASVSMDATSGDASTSSDAAVDAVVDAGSDAMLPSIGDASPYDYCQTTFACEFGQVLCSASLNPAMHNDVAVLLHDCASVACAEDDRDLEYAAGQACAASAFASASADVGAAAYCSTFMACDVDGGGSLFTTDYCQRIFGAVSSEARDAFIAGYPEPDRCFTAEDLATWMVWALTE